MKRLLSSFSLLILASGLIPVSASAGGCYVDPVMQYSGSGSIKSAVFLRSEACVSGTMVLKTLAAGSRVEVVGYTDGWYEVVSGGKRGWIGQQFLTSSASETGVRWNSYEEYRSYTPAEIEEVKPQPTPAPSEETYSGNVEARMLIKLACPAGAAIDHPCKAVYYIGADGKRHAFPNSRVFFTWYSNFDGVRAVTAERLGQYMLGLNVTYRPGARMVKFTTDPKVYVVGRGGILRWVKTEALARAYYGDTWNTKIDDIPDAFYTNYTFGADVEAEADFSPSAEVQANITLD